MSSAKNRRTERSVIGAVSRKYSFVIHFLISFEKKHPGKSLFYTSCMRDVNAEIKNHKEITWS